ncbi:response regulator [Rhodovulum sp. PH10]|uniref:response regulator n=1 Tax=Rhodovulum sp. PH10 TaxID=1187851 RepID=UPI00178C6839|nr:response regulator [Rhodovulum sp. PH10]
MAEPAAVSAGGAESETPSVVPDGMLVVEVGIFIDIRYRARSRVRAARNDGSNLVHGTANSDACITIAGHRTMHGKDVAERRGPMARILVIDDDELVRTSLRVLLETEGHELVLVENGRAGLASAGATPFDLVICDVFMPEMDGFETIRALHRRHPSLPVLVMSGNRIERTGAPAPDFLRMAVDLGAVGSLRKPLQASEILAAVARCLAVRPGPAT